MTAHETILSVIPGATEHQRLVVVVRSMHQRNEASTSLALFDPESGQARPKTTVSVTETKTFCEEVIAVRDRPIVLRQESFSPAVGWFTQSELEMTEAQWAMMRCTVVPQQPKPAPMVARRNFDQAAAIVPFTASA